MIEASAPGKLFLCGEYAVLEGAPAMACAVGRRVRVRLSQFSTPETGQAARWRKAATRLLHDEGFKQAPTARELEIDSESLYSEHGDKYGLGSSAAVAAAVTGALLAACGARPDTAEKLRLASALHRSLQGPGGSGVDVAASLYGGVIAVSNGRPEQLAWPTGLHSSVIWTGRATDTPQALERYREALKRGSRGVKAAVKRLKGEASTAKQAWQQGAAEGLAALEQYATAWQALDRAAGLGVYSAPHLELVELARAAGCLYKPSGAGGGDCGLALALDPQAVARMRRMAAALGYQALDMELAVPGMTVTRR